MLSTELAARRGVDSCRQLLKTGHLTVSEAIEEAKNNRSKNIQVAGEQLEDLRHQLRNDIIKWFEGGEPSGFLTAIPKEKLSLWLKEEDEDIPEPPKNSSIPMLDMSGLRVTSPDNSEFKIQNRKIYFLFRPTKTPRTPVVSDIPSWEDIEVVEVSDSSANNSDLLNKMTDDVIRRINERIEIPTISARRTNKNINIPIIQSTPLVRIQLKETAVQTNREDNTKKVDAATSYTLPQYEDNGEVSTSENSDPSIGQVDQTKVHPKKIISVLEDGSIFLVDESSEEFNNLEWKPPLELVRIAERDISSSFASEDIEVVSANASKKREAIEHREALYHSDEEPTANQVSPLMSKSSN